MRMNMNDFRKWLVSKANLSDDSSSDVISRLNRALKLSNLDEDDSPKLIEQKVMTNPQFKKLSQFVRPQILRSIKLYHEFKSR